MPRTRLAIKRAQNLPNKRKSGLKPAQLQRKRENEKKRRDGLKKKQRLYKNYLEAERNRKRQAVEQGKIKKRSDMNDRELRLERRKVRERVRLCRLRKKNINEENVTNNDSNSCDAASLNNDSNSCDAVSHHNDSNSDTASPSVPAEPRSRAQIIGERLRNTARKRDKKKIQELEAEIVAVKRELWRLKKQRTRKNRNIPSPQLSPRSQCNRLTRGKFVNPTVKKILFENCALRTELRNSFKSISSSKERKQFCKYISGKVLKSCRILNSMKGVFPKKKFQPRRLHKSRQMENPKTGTSIVKFLESKFGSSICPGKKQGRSYNGVQKQRQYMVADLRTLHKEYLAQNNNVYVSYRTFCRYRPAWIVAPKMSSRDTCLCKLCENFSMLLTAAKNSNMIPSSSRSEIAESLCCQEASIDCFLRSCNKCHSKKIVFKECNVEKELIYRQWVTVKEKVYSFKSKSEIEIRAMKKNCTNSTVGELKSKIEKEIIVYMQHIGRVKNQTLAADTLINSLKESEMVLLIDWSMNFVCKYGREPQSVHFGASHTQLGLHTGRLYFAGGESQSFCTLSEVTRHDPFAIIAHLIPILRKYLALHPEVTSLYFLSDGPTSQYRNRDLYWLVAKYLMKLFPQITKVEWIFSEAGHGKGEADGVGGVVKRTADRVVVYGGDVDNLVALVKILKARCPSIDLEVISLSDIIAIDSIKVPKTQPLKGTMQVHHYIWVRDKPMEIEFKLLSCPYCPRDGTCPHHRLVKSWPLKDPQEVAKPPQKAQTKNTKEKAQTTKPAKKKGEPKEKVTCAGKPKSTKGASKHQDLPKRAKAPAKRKR